MNRLRNIASAMWPPLPVWKRLDAAVLAMLIYFVIVGVIFEITDLRMPKWGGMLTLLNAIVLGVLLQFRNRESYDRWWEARRVWGNLVSDSRNLCMKISAQTGISVEDRGELGRLVFGFAVSLKDYLRGGKKPLQAVPSFEADPVYPMHIPLEFARRITVILRVWRDKGTVGDRDMLMLDPHSRAMCDALGVCERIKNTPLPLSYRSLLRHGLVLYLLSCPWLVFDDIGWWGLPAIALLTYFLLGIEFTAEDVEEPFGRDSSELALTAYCETIRQSVVEILGITNEALSFTLETTALKMPPRRGG